MCLFSAVLATTSPQPSPPFSTLSLWCQLPSLTFNISKMVLHSWSSQTPKSSWEDYHSLFLFCHPSPHSLMLSVCLSPTLSPSPTGCINVPDFFCEWHAFLSLMDFLCLCPFLSLPNSSHTKIRYPKSFHWTSYCSQNFSACCYPSLLSTVQTQDMCATHPINCPFPLWFVHTDLQFKMGTLRFIFTLANNYHIMPQHSSSMLNDLSSMSAQPNPIAPNPGKFYVSPSIGSYWWEKPMSYFCTCSSARHITHQSVHP